MPNPNVAEYLARFADRLPSNDELWAEMDRVWDALGLDNRAPDPSRLGEFYAHPVWVLNGLFSEQDQDSVLHRRAIAGEIRKTTSPAHTFRIADFGGGSGVLARFIVQECPGARVDIIEPAPNAYFVAKVAGHDAIRFVRDFSSEPYDVVIAQDVLEHVADPVGDALRCIGALRVGGHVLFANCFKPAIKCHLPATFHLDFTFRFVVSSQALRCIGTLPEAPHVQIYEKRAEVNPKAVRRRAWLAARLGPVLNRASEAKVALEGALGAGR